MDTADQNRILVIDDQDDLREMIAIRLSSAGYQVETASNGQEALDKVRDFSPVLVVSDVQMPEMDGFTLVKELKRVSRELFGEPIPIIMMTGHKKGPEMQALFEMEGVDGYLEKPLDGRLLLIRIQEVLSRKKA